MIEPKYLATAAIPSYAQQDLALRVCILPAGPFGKEVGRTLGVDVFRAAQDLPAGIFAFPVA